MLPSTSSSFILLCDFCFMQKLMNATDSEKKEKVEQIKNLYAFDLICRKKKFEEALKLFTELDTGLDENNYKLLGYN